MKILPFRAIFQLVVEKKSISFEFLYVVTFDFIIIYLLAITK